MPTSMKLNIERQRELSEAAMVLQRHSEVRQTWRGEVVTDGWDRIHGRVSHIPGRLE
jgi:hypothetical protein